MDSPIEQPTSNVAQSSLPRRIFVGPLGPRAGWCLLLYVTLVFCIIMGQHAIHHHFHHAAAAATHVTTPPAASEPEPVLPITLINSIAFGLLLLLSWLMATIEHRRVAVYGLGGQRPLGRFLVGAFWGLAAISLLIFALSEFHFLQFDTRLLHGRAILGWGAAQLVGFLFVGLLEEFAFRGYLQFTLTRGLIGLGNAISRPHARAIAFWSAAIISSALFFLAHTGNDGENKLGLFQVFLFGLVLIIALWRTGSLWWAIGFHMAWDWGQSFLYGVPDSGGLIQGRLFATHAMGNPLFSGGTVGPEGSLFTIPIIVLTLVVLYFTRPSPQPALEQLPYKGDISPYLQTVSADLAS